MIEGPRAAPSLLVLPPRLVPHVVRALAEHLRWLRVNRLPAPPELAAMLAALTETASDGPERTTLGDLAAPVEPVAVDFKTAAAALSVSERTVRRLVASGRLGSVQVGRRRLIPAGEVMRFVEGGAA